MSTRWVQSVGRRFLSGINGRQNRVRNDDHHKSSALACVEVSLKISSELIPLRQPPSLSEHEYAENTANDHRPSRKKLWHVTARLAQIREL